MDKADNVFTSKYIYLTHVGMTTSFLFFFFLGGFVLLEKFPIYSSLYLYVSTSISLFFFFQFGPLLGIPPPHVSLSIE